MKAGGCDRVDIDREEEGGGISGNYTLLMKELRVALDTLTPRSMLTIATASNQVASAVAVKDVVDQMNVMSYWTPVAGPAYDAGGGGRRREASLLAALPVGQ